MSVELSAIRVSRWAASDGRICFPCEAESATVACGGSTVQLKVEQGKAWLPLLDAKRLMQCNGSYTLDYSDSDGNEREYIVERVSNRYTDRDAVIAYGKQSNDGFDDEQRYPLSAFSAAIQAAEEAIERGCRRRFCRSSITAMLRPGRITELPVCDAFCLECADQSVALASASQASGVTETVEARIGYGLTCDSRIAQAATMLAASYLRPRAMAENARGTSMDGVYISYDLATGDDGGWTGLPFVDAVIEDHRSHRSVVG